MPDDVPADKLRNHVISDAECRGEDQPADTDSNPAQCWPPHPMHGDVLERVFNLIDCGAQGCSE